MHIVPYDSPDNKPKTFECDDCKDEGVIPDFARNVAVQCPCMKLKRVNHVLKHSKIGAEFRAKTFENFTFANKDIRIVQACKMAQKYADNFDEIRATEANSFGFAGAVGSGKTHMASAVANALLARGIVVRYFNCVTGFQEMFAKYDEGGAAVDAIRQDLFSADVLFLDELGLGKLNPKTKLNELSEPVIRELYSIVNYRYDNRLPIIWTSEMFEDLLDVLRPRTASRLFQMSAGNIAQIMYEQGENIHSLNHRLE